VAERFSVGVGVAKDSANVGGRGVSKKATVAPRKTAIMLRVMTETDERMNN
jgi:hypothetical protein